MLLPSTRPDGPYTNGCSCSACPLKRERAGVPSGTAPQEGFPKPTGWMPSAWERAPRQPSTSGRYALCLSPPMDTAAGRNATSTRSVSLVPSPKVPEWSRASKRGISSELPSTVAPNRASTLDGFSFGQAGHLMSERNKVGYRGLAIASVPWFIDAMAIVT